MSREIETLWDARHEAQTHAGPPAQVLEQNLYLLPGQGDALDLACGLGANAACLARHGLSVEARDISGVALSKLASSMLDAGFEIRLRQCDVMHEPLVAESFDVIVVSYFLERDLFPKLIDALRPKGLLYYQTFLQEGDGTGPQNPAYRLAPNELLELCRPLRLIYYRENGHIGDMAQGLRNEAMLIGMKPAG